MGGEEVEHCVGIFKGGCLEFLEADLSPKERKEKDENRHRKQRTFQVKLNICYFYSYSVSDSFSRETPLGRLKSSLHVRPYYFCHLFTQSLCAWKCSCLPKMKLLELG